MPPVDGLKVVRSSIHGYGVVTLREFKKGDVVIYADGVIYREDEEFDDEYALILPGYEADEHGNEGPPMYYDLADQTRWINHSCDPNTEVDSSWDPITKSINPWWVAIKDIPVGEELTYDYAFSGHLAIPCLCRMDACRGLIVDPDELHLVPDNLKHHSRLPIPAPPVAAPPLRDVG